MVQLVELIMLMHFPHVSAAEAVLLFGTFYDQLITNDFMGPITVLELEDIPNSAFDLVTYLYALYVAANSDIDYVIPYFGLFLCPEEEAAPA